MRTQLRPMYTYNISDYIDSYVYGRIIDRIGFNYCKVSYESKYIGSYDIRMCTKQVQVTYINVIGIGKCYTIYYKSK
jgi:hypothetical protein